MEGETLMAVPPYRKPNLRYGGVEVRICGKPIQEGVVCNLPPNHPKIIHHAAVAIADNNALVAVVRLMESEETVVWQLVDPPE